MQAVQWLQVAAAEQGVELSTDGTAVIDYSKLSTRLVIWADTISGYYDAADPQPTACRDEHSLVSLSAPLDPVDPQPFEDKTAFVTDDGICHMRREDDIQGFEFTPSEVEPASTE